MTPVPEKDDALCYHACRRDANRENAKFHSFFGFLLLAYLLVGCTLELATTPPPAAPTLTLTPVPSIAPGQPATSGPWQDLNHLMSGICFEAAQDAAGQVFVFRNEAELQAFYDLADNSTLCRRPVNRPTPDPPDNPAPDFDSGAIMAGLWSAGRGCTARHTLATFQRDEAEQVIRITLEFITEGECNYELVRPFWIGLEDTAGYTVEITVN